MSDRPEGPAASLPDATAQVAQEHGPPTAAPRPTPAPTPDPTPTFTCETAAGVTRAARVRPYVRRSDDALYRRLRIFSLDPAQPKLEGAVALVKIPYEPLDPGPVGRLFEVDDRELERKVRYARVDLDEQKALIQDGRDPSPSDPQFHQQMVYAVCMNVYAAFKAALGRNVGWGFDSPAAPGGAPDAVDPNSLLRLRLIPHAKWEKNAYYSREDGAIHFGYYRAKEDVGAKNPKGGFIFTCLSHDIVAHELGHALLDGLRSRYLLPTRPDVLAFHEAFGDLIAIFQHFAYRDVLLSALRRSGPALDRAQVMGSLAGQFGFTAAGRSPLRTAIEVADGQPRQYKTDIDVHDLGSVLVSAVFETFATLFKRKTERYVRLATGGSGVLPEGALSHQLEQTLAEEASQLASQMLQLCIRAVDYCPPVDLDFGDYLRAMITADAELVPDDPWAYRETLVDAFGRRGVFPSGVLNLAEDSLRWRPPWRPINIPELDYSHLRFAGDPAQAAPPEDLQAQAQALGRTVADPQYVDVFGLAQPDGEFLRPSVEAIRTARRVGPDGQVLFDLVAEVVQERIVKMPNDRRATFVGGATVIIDPDGAVRYVIVKSIRNDERLEQFRTYVGGGGSKLWMTNAEEHVPRKALFQLAHAEEEPVGTDSV